MVDAGVRDDDRCWWEVSLALARRRKRRRVWLYGRDARGRAAFEDRAYADLRPGQHGRIDGRRRVDHHGHVRRDRRYHERGNLDQVCIESGPRRGDLNRHDRRHGNELQAARRGSRGGKRCRSPRVNKGLTLNSDGKPLLTRGLRIRKNMDFTVNKETKTVTITAEFDAERDLVWDAYTKPELLDQWWAPKPYSSRTKVMEFREGGRRFYAMVSPDGQERWAVQKYTSITPKTNFKIFNAFADKDENLELPGSEWDLNFIEQGGTTKVSISIYNESLERLERMVAMGFKEGTAATFDNLKELLAQLSQKRIA